MLAADKLQLQSQLKQQATALKEKEFNLHHENLMTVGTQAAVLAGLDITMFIEFNPPHNDDWGQDLKLFPRVLKFFYYMTIVSAFCANMIVVSHTTTLSVLGAGLALRGPDGSMMTATDGLYEERKAVFQIFGIGLACTVGSVVIAVWILLSWESSVFCMMITLMTCQTIWKNYQRVHKRFVFDESETVDFKDILNGPAAIQAVPLTSSKSSSSAYFRQPFPKGSQYSQKQKKPYYNQQQQQYPEEDYYTTSDGSEDYSYEDRGGYPNNDSRSQQHHPHHHHHHRQRYRSRQHQHLDHDEENQPSTSTSRMFSPLHIGRPNNKNNNTTPNNNNKGSRTSSTVQQRRGRSTSPPNDEEMTPFIQTV